MSSTNLLSFQLQDFMRSLNERRSSLQQNEHKFLPEDNYVYFPPPLPLPWENSELSSAGKELFEDTPACPCK